ncbi:hypothetical protein PSN45_002776 [Yamadazyma tenuis]|uniref:uncharacterized protein n=1 Tax=Candida tenuis TaxID=2315449 RepID=UPI00279F5B79|nr:hypothetical protein PSN45_002776 [Yamadazyma tenuis]
MEEDKDIGKEGSNFEEPKVLESESVINHIKGLGKDFKSKTNADVYLKLEIGVPEARYFEQNIETIHNTLKNNFHITDFTISDPVKGAIERYITINGKVEAALKAGLYVAYVVRAVLNNILHEVLTLKSPNYKLVMILTDEMTEDRVRQIEQRAKFTSIRYYDLVKPSFYQSSGSISKLAVMGHFKSIYDTLSYVLETSEHKYLDDRLIFQYPVVQADESSLFQQQDFNVNKLDENIKKTLEFIYNKEFLQQNEII